MPVDGLDISEISDGPHILTINANDRVGLEATKSFNFVVDTEPPSLEIKSPKNNTSVSNVLFIDLSLDDDNLPEEEMISFLLPTGERIIDKAVYSFDTSQIDDGQYEIILSGIDKAGNSVTHKIMFTIDHTIIDKPKISESEGFDPIVILIIIGVCLLYTSDAADE